jgi:putative transcriptional regulator
MKSKKVTNDNFSDLLLESVGESVAHAQGRITLRSEELSLPDKPPKFSKQRIRKIRKGLNISQGVFAELLNVSVKTVQAWERGDSVPKGTTTRLFQVIENDPELFLASLTEDESA